VRKESGRGKPISGEYTGRKLSTVYQNNTTVEFL